MYLQHRLLRRRNRIVHPLLPTSHHHNVRQTPSRRHLHRTKHPVDPSKVRTVHRHHHHHSAHLKQSLPLQPHHNRYHEQHPPHDPSQDYTWLPLLALPLYLGWSTLRLPLLGLLRIGTVLQANAAEARRRKVLITLQKGRSR